MLHNGVYIVLSYNRWLDYLVTSQNMLLSFVQFLFRSCDQYRTSMQKAHITNNNEIIVLAHSRVVISKKISLSGLLTTRKHMEM